MSNTSRFTCVEQITGAYDGHYAKESEARFMSGFLGALWPFSKWEVVTTASSVWDRGQFHRDASMQERLKKVYGDPDFDAADKFKVRGGKK